MIRHNRWFRRFNPVACIVASAVLWSLLAFHELVGKEPGLSAVVLATLLNLGFLVRGELNWRRIVGAARQVGP